MKKQLELFYDVCSPYSWFAFEVATRVCRGPWNVELRLRPFLLGGVMQATGNKPPLLLAPRAAAMIQDLRRHSKYWNVPLVAPAPTEAIYSSLKAQRLLVSCMLNNEGEGLEELSRQLWLRIWSRHEPIDTEEGLLSALAAAGFSGPTAEKILKGGNDEAVKRSLKAVTEEAVSRGVYGAPTFFASKGGEASEMFFGQDRFHLLADYFGEPWPVPEARHPIKAKL